MKIALIGYGKMGKEIEKIALERGHQVVAIVDAENPIHDVDFNNVDVAIDFSMPNVVLNNIEHLINSHTPIVVGTTGWNEHLNDVTEMVNLKNGSLLHASNFSVGVNLFFMLNEHLAKLMNTQKSYYASMTEIHHTQKLDAPSGTAISLAEGIMKNHDAVNDWSCPQHPTKNVFEGGIEIEALRIENVPGTHSVIYDSEVDQIEIKHTAHNRQGFALGAVIAAEWLQDKKGVFTMNDVLKLN